MQEKKLTGYPSIDMPWLKYYQDCDRKEIPLENESIYCNFVRIVNKKPNQTAFIDYKSGVKMTYKDLLIQSDEFANGLVSLGATQNSIIGILGFNCIYEAALLLGTNKIGATIVFLDPGDGILGIKKNVTELDFLFIENNFAELEVSINPYQIPTVIIGDCPIKPRNNCIAFDSFINQRQEMIIKPVVIPFNKSALVIFSSGSTGAPKPIVHSNYSVNTAVRNILFSDFPLEEKNYLIKAIPSHIGLGIITTLLTALLGGIPYIQMKGFPDPVIDLLGETLDLLVNFEQWKQQNGLDPESVVVLFAAPIFAKYILKDIKRFNDLSFIKGTLLGGSKMTEDELEILNAELSKKHLKVPICNGYGQNEMGGAVALNTIHHNRNGSAGYPVFGTNIRIVNRETHIEVPYNTIGQIFEQSDSHFLGYFNMLNKTEQAVVKMPDGSEWYDSTDLGYMDEDGFLYITGRTTRVVIKADHKVSMEVVEEKIGSINLISEVAVVPYGQDGDIVAFICRKDKNVPEEHIIQTIKTEAGLSIFENPVKYLFMKELPRMNNGKIDYQSLEKEAN